ncbi:MAG: HAD family hydrolase [Cyclobacteriaceae bacterium]
MARAIIFDLDGTLWDASASCANAWNHALRDIGAHDQSISPATVRAFSGLRIQHVLEQFFSFVPTELHSDLLESYRLHEPEELKIQGGTLYPGVKETLTDLARDYKLLIVSNCLKGYIPIFLSFHQLDPFFAGHECSGNTGLPKHENIRRLMTQHSVSKTCYVGDTHWDQEAAAVNSIPFVFAAYGFGSVANPTHQVMSFQELRDLCGKLLPG